jgi:AcrR family transcriptional regulator
MAESAEVVGASVDPRVRRTRLMLHDGLDKLLKEKDFDKISVQDVADAAGLNRATFYDHYSDKFALLECLVGSRFGALMERRGVKYTECDGALRAIVLGVCDYMVSVPGRLEGHIESAVIAVVRGMLLEGMARHERADGAVPAKMVAAAVSWAIYGACREWMYTPDRWEAEEVVGKIEDLVKGMMQAGG